MDNSKQYLLEIVDEQKKTIEKYSNKLRDVVAAHKSLLIEKKALENTIQILSESKTAESSNNETQNSDSCNSEYDDQNKASENLTQEELKSKLDSLLASFSNLVAEKSHMEECFKTNQKQLLEEKEAVETKCKDLQEQVKVLSKELKFMESKNQNEYGFLKKDAKKNLRGMVRNSKREDKDEKSKNYENESIATQIKGYEKELSNLKSELDAKKLIQELSERKLKDSTVEVRKLQDEIRNIQMEHEMALQMEKEKAKYVEDHAKKLTAVQEERVVNLETRLAELSDTIGCYDRLRLQDQKEIQKLKEHIAFINISQKGVPSDIPKPESETSDDFDNIYKQIIELKRKLQDAAIKSGREKDFKQLFSDNQSSEDVHLTCKTEYMKLKSKFDLLKSESELYNNQSKSGKEGVLLQNQIKNLQEKVRILNDKNKELEKDYQLRIEQLKQTIKNDKSKFKETLSATESDYKARVWLLEEQLQKQRERSLALLEEKEQEIHALQSTFQMFLPGYHPKSEDESANDSNVLIKSQMLDGPHIVHYANELARRDVEISNLRKTKHQVEMSLRGLQKELATVNERLKEERDSLNKEIARLERCQTREGANLEYLKNVVYSFLLSSDPKSKQHMCNAIAAVLKFSDSELQKVIDHSKNRWWTRSNIL